MRSCAAEHTGQSLENSHEFPRTTEIPSLHLQGNTEQTRTSIEQTLQEVPYYQKWIDHEKRIAEKKARGEPLTREEEEQSRVAELDNIQY